MKKLIALLMAVLMVMCLFTGCGKKKRQAGSIVDGKYVPAEEFDITLWYTQGLDFTPGNEIADNVVSKWVYDNTLVKVANIYGNGGGQWDNKLSTLVAGNNLPNVIACGAGQGPAHFAKLAENKLVLEITDEMLETYAPNYLKRVPKETIDMFRVDGKLYGLPYYQVSSKATNPDLDDETLEKIDEYIRGITKDEHCALWIRDDVLKKIYPQCKTWKEIYEVAKEGAPCMDLAHDIPITTKEEYVDFMYKIKDLNLKSDTGKPMYAFGYSGGDNWEALNYIGGDIMGYSPQYYTSAWKDDTKEIVIPLVEDIAYEGAKLQNKMLRDNVFDRESLLHTTDIYTEKVLDGQYAIFAGDMIPGGVEGLNNKLEAEGKSYRYRPFAVNIPNDPGYLPGKTQNKWTKSICFTKVNDENDLIQLLNWVNVTCSDEFEEVFWWGTPEDGLYTEEDGVRTYTDDRFNKRFIDGDKAALENKDTKGIGVEAVDAGVWYVNPVNEKQTKYAPVIYNKTFKLTPYQAVTKVTPDSEHAVTRLFPPAYVWDACYADIPDVVQFWAQREQWENAFKKAFTAESDDDFEAKWNEAKDELARICDVDVMAKEMTEVAREEYKKIEQ
ncbi:MAG: hypothetical protein J5590_00030 [Clostridia bacterium]|nr:hypothetical protein [Clostridia bacterium]